MQQKIINYLIEKYEAKGIILYGSRAVGKEVDSSDWDIFIFSDRAESEIVDFGELDEYQGQQIDLSVYPTTFAEDFILDTATHPVNGAVVLYDNLDGKMQILVNNSNLAYSKGPKEVNQRQKKLQRKILRKYLNKAKSRPEDTATIYFAVSQFFIFAVRYWFEINKLWPLPFYEALKIIKDKDIEFFINLGKLYRSEYSFDEKIKSMEYIYEKLFK